MFGTVAKLKFKPGMMKKFMEENLEQYENPNSGSLAVFAFDTLDEPNTALLVAVSESEEAYKKNADDPKTHERFMKMMEYLESEPEWNDGHVIYSKLYKSF
jgi:quinol monooxygenase YgiN